MGWMGTPSYQRQGVSPDPQLPMDRQHVPRPLREAPSQFALVPWSTEHMVIASHRAAEPSRLGQLKVTVRYQVH